MTKPKYPQKYRNYIKNLIQYISSVMNADEYKASVIFCEAADESDLPEGGVVMMDITVDCDYLQYVIRVYPEVYETYLKKDYTKIGEYVIHELSHIITQPLRDLYENNMPGNMKGFALGVLERQTQRVANCILNLIAPDWADIKYHGD